MEVTAETVMADRKRRGMSRAKYSQLVGLTQTQVHNIEHGRALKPGEPEILLPFLMQNDLGTVPPSPAPTTSKPPARRKKGATSDTPSPLSLVPPLPPDGEGDVVLLSDEEEEEAGDEPAASKTWGLPARYDFKLPGYHVSNSELSCLKRCRRKWWLAYYRELRLKQPQVTGARAIGTRLHIALSSYYSTKREDPMAVLEATIADDKRILEEGTDVDALTTLEKDADLARAMLEGYLEWLKESGADEGLEVVGNETVVEVPLFEGVALVGKMDLRVRRTFDGARLFLDHKTTGSLTEPLKTLHLDEQCLHYHLLEFLEFLQAGMTKEEAEKEHTMGGLYNMMRKVKRTQTAKPPFFDRVEVRHNVHELRSYYLRVWGEVTTLLELRRQLDEGADHRVVAYPTPRRDCSWDCDFLPVCPMFDDGSASEELLAEYYEQGDPHTHYAPHGEREIERGET